MFDAQATRALGDYWISTKDKHRDLYELHGITTSFVSTRAGLTRWKEVGDSSASRDSASFVTAAYSTDVAYPDDFANQTFLPVLETKYVIFIPSMKNPKTSPTFCLFGIL